jgi:hypothetical protein
VPAFFPQTFLGKGQAFPFLDHGLALRRQLVLKMGKGFFAFLFDIDHAIVFASGKRLFAQGTPKTIAHFHSLSRIIP